MNAFLFHPPGITVKIIETDCSTHTRWWYYHHICGSLLAEDFLLIFEGYRFLLMTKRSPSSSPTIFLLCWLP